jgi:hypothetical protein
MTWARAVTRGLKSSPLLVRWRSRNMLPIIYAAGTDADRAAQAPVLFSVAACRNSCTLLDAACASAARRGALAPNASAAGGNAPIVRPARCYRLSTQRQCAFLCFGVVMGSVCRQTSATKSPPTRGSIQSPLRRCLCDSPSQLSSA